MNNEELLTKLRMFVLNCGTQRAACIKIGCSTAYLSAVLRGDARPGPKILKALGVRKSVVYDAQ